jgi:hypothetical protein
MTHVDQLNFVIGIFPVTPQSDQTRNSLKLAETEADYQNTNWEAESWST